MLDLEHAFLAAIVADPSEPAHRLAYADWLDEQGTDERAAEAEVWRCIRRFELYENARPNLILNYPIRWWTPRIREARATVETRLADTQRRLHYDLTCIHSEQGLCPACWADCREDEESFREFGDHPAGIANVQRLQSEMDADMREMVDAPPVDMSDIPF